MTWYLIMSLTCVKLSFLQGAWHVLESPTDESVSVLSVKPLNHLSRRSRQHKQVKYSSEIETGNS
jgi:hypothetical protein